jgi:hypothetical protein
MNEISKKQQILQDLRKFVLSKASIVYILSDEEDRIEGLLKELSSTFQPKPKLFVWNPFQGLAGESERVDNSKNYLEALDKVIQRTELSRRKKTEGSPPRIAQSILHRVYRRALSGGPGRASPGHDCL